MIRYKVIHTYSINSSMCDMGMHTFLTDCDNVDEDEKLEGEQFTIILHTVWKNFNWENHKKNLFHALKHLDIDENR